MLNKIYYKISCSFFLARLSVNLISMGTIVGAASSSKGIKLTATIVLIQALGCITSLCLFKGFKRLNNNLLLYKLTTLGITFLTILISFLKINTASWFMVFFLKFSLLNLLLAFLNAEIPNISERSNIAKLNQKIQSLGVIALITGWSMGPLIAQRYDLNALFILDSIISILFTVILFTRKKDFQSLGIKENQNIENQKLDFSFKKFFIIIFSTWCVCGVFHVAEVPYLKEVINSSAEEVSLLFFLAAISNFLSMRFLKHEILNKNVKNLLFLSATLLILLSGIYFSLTSIISIYVLIIVFGIFNGIFTLSVTGIILNEINGEKRIYKFLITKIFSQVGLIASCLISYVLDFSEIQMITIPFLFLIFIIFLFERKIKDSSQKLSSKLASVLFITLSLISIPKEAVAQNSFKAPILRIPENLEPTSSVDISTAFIYRQIFDNLYEYDSKNNIKPSLAKGHIFTNNRKSIKIFLRDKIYFSDGEEIDARHIEFCIKRAILKLKQSLRWALGDLEGFDSFISHNDITKNIKGIKVINKKTIQLNFQKPFKLILPILTTTYFSIYKINSSGKIIGSGDYSMVKKGKNLLTLNKSKHSQYPKAPQKVELPLFRKAAEILKKETDLDIIPYLEKEYKIPENYKLIQYNYFQILMLYMNTKNNKLKSKDLRCYLTNKISEVAIKSGYKWGKLQQALPFSWDMFKELSYSKKKILSKDKFSIYFSESNEFGLIDEYNKKMEKDIKGETEIDVKFIRTPISNIIEGIKSKKINIALLGFVPDYIDPDSYLSPTIQSKQQYNLFSYSNEKIDLVLTLARSLSNENDRNIMYRKIFEILSTECPVGFLGSSKGSILVSDRWLVPKMNGLGIHSFKIRNVTSNSGEN